MSRGQPEWKRKLFDTERDCHSAAIRTARNNPPHLLHTHIRRGQDWILFGPQDIRHSAPEYHFSLIYTSCDKTVRVRAGCRFKTIEQAWTHWGKRARSSSSYASNQGKQALAIITLMLLQAQALGLLTWRERRAKYKVPTPKLPERIKRTR